MRGTSRKRGGKGGREGGGGGGGKGGKSGGGECNSRWNPKAQYIRLSTNSNVFDLSEIGIMTPYSSQFNAYKAVFCALKTGRLLGSGRVRKKDRSGGSDFVAERGVCYKITYYLHCQFLTYATISFTVYCGPK